MQRIVFVVVALFVLWKVLSAWGRKIRSQTAGADEFSRFKVHSRMRQRRRQAQQRENEALVACAACGTMIPVSRSLQSGDQRVVCSRECGEALAEGSAGGS